MTTKIYSSAHFTVLESNSREAKIQLEIEGNPHHFHEFCAFGCTWILSIRNSKINCVLQHTVRHLPLKVRYEFSGQMQSAGIYTFSQVGESILFKNDGCLNDLTCIVLLKTFDRWILDEKKSNFETKELCKRNATRLDELASLQSDVVELQRREPSITVDHVKSIVTDELKALKLETEFIASCRRNAIDQLQVANERMESEIQDISSKSRTASDEVTAKIQSIRSEMKSQAAKQWDESAELRMQNANLKCELAKMKSENVDIQGRMDTFMQSIADEMTFLKLEMENIRCENSLLRVINKTYHQNDGNESDKPGSLHEQSNPAQFDESDVSEDETSSVGSSTTQ